MTGNSQSPLAKAAVVIPYHKPFPSALELISLKRCCKILGNYPRYLVIPEGMNIDVLIESDEQLIIKYMNPSWFKSSVNYNLLCRHFSFYEYFLKFEYILLYQLDAYVFSDELNFWCDKKYDYIGAPWLNFEFQTHSKKKWGKAKWLRPFLKRVGNGGFSLRRVSIFKTASRFLWGLSLFFRNIPEDVFWSNVGQRIWPFFKFPDISDALAFAWDSAPSECFSLCGGKMPFGIHAWNTDYLEFWRDKIDEMRQT